MTMNQVELLNSKEDNKGIFYFAEYHFINDKKNLMNLLTKANNMKKKFKVNKFILFGYFDQEAVKEFLGKEICKSYAVAQQKSSSDFFDALDERESKYHFQILLVDYINMNQIQKYFGSSDFYFVLDKNNKIIFTSKRNYFKYLRKIFLLGFVLSLGFIYVFFPSLETLIFIN